MTRALRIDDVYRFEIPCDPSLSPDGERVAYTLTTQDAERDCAVTSIWEVRGTDGPARRLTRGPSDAAPRWSPDGTRLAFLRAGQLHLLPADGGEAAPLTTAARCPAGAGVPVWSPDGSRIAFAGPGSLREDTAPVVIDGLGWKVDGAGLLGAVRTQLFVVEVESGEVRQLTDGDRHAGPPAWSPDGTRLAYPAPTGPDADVTGTSAAHVVEAGAAVPAPVRVGPSTGVAGPVSWYPDGSALLVVGRTTMGVGHLELLRQPLDGSAPVSLSAPLDRNVLPGGPGYPGALPQFHGDGIVFCARDRGATRLYRVDASGIGEFALPAGQGVSGCSVAAKAGRAALVVSDTASFAEIALLDLADAGSGRPGGPSTGRQPARLTAHMARSLPDVALHPFTEREFTISDGTVVHGMITRAPGTAPGGPLLVDVHGGPHNAWAPHADPAHLYHQELVSRGWTVLTLNVRGSDGYGESFYRAAVGAWGEADEQDVLEPIAALIDEGLVDPARIALTGYSYGGYLTCWLSARSDLFAAVVPGGVVADLTSLAGTSEEGYLIAGHEIGDRDRLTALSPLSHVDAVRAPTLILHGGADDTCPVGQAEQWFHALRTRGVPVRLVLYPGCSHLFILNGRPSHREDYSRRLVDWVTTHADR
ncbi:Prolyl tripeptidyl peptidase precursor [Streptomyces sp. ADI92-24]|uniref:S9 family peptidase n=1 Tax=unclassified Streptomyces TaxID=2593676 RepID=UPI000F47398C|nr:MULTISPECIES: S9 family peptidase [unclassified Streptomyces]ROQ78298.1 dipeptidyl aminopeptidase/acylaminoacyl peptidase [Streptomyces sp. CEV 2-1]RPK37467.1 Prolyl tripeptidyl peptidase precursor [Streptomyces sp. ADI92-24]